MLQNFQHVINNRKSEGVNAPAPSIRAAPQLPTSTPPPTHPVGLGVDAPKLIEAMYTNPPINQVPPDRNTQLTRHMLQQDFADAVYLSRNELAVNTQIKLTRHGFLIACYTGHLTNTQSPTTVDRSQPLNIERESQTRCNEFHETQVRTGVPKVHQGFQHRGHPTVRRQLDPTERDIVFLGKISCLIRERKPSRPLHCTPKRRYD